MKKKMRIECFDFYDTSGLEQHLEEMAAKGWLLCDISPGWIYQIGEPQRIKYTVTYFHDASEYNPYPSNEQEEFIAYCEAAGWKLAAENGKMQIFCSTAEKPIPIETDEELKLRSIHSIMKINLFLWSVILIIIIMNMYLAILKLFDYPLQYLSNTDYFIFLLIDFFAILVLIAEIIRYTAWHKRSVKAIERGDRCCKVKLSIILRFPIIPLLLFMIICLITKSITLLLGMLLCIIIVLVSLFSATFIRRILKKHGASYWENVSISSLSVLIILMVLFTSLTHIVDRAIESVKSANSEKAVIMDQYNQAKEWELIQDELPLTLEELNASEGLYYSYEKHQQASFLLSYLQGSQSAVHAGRMKTILEYEIADVKANMFYEQCLNDLKKLHLGNNTYWQEVNDSLWQANAVYRLYHNEKPFHDQYLICWDNRIIRIEFNWEVTSEQLMTAATKLRNTVL